MSLEHISLLAQWNTAQQMVRESNAPTASSWERTQKARRVEWAAELGKQCLAAGLLASM